CRCWANICWAIANHNIVSLPTGVQAAWADDIARGFEVNAGVSAARWLRKSNPSWCFEVDVFSTVFAARLDNKISASNLWYILHQLCIALGTTVAWVNVNHKQPVGHNDAVATSHPSKLIERISLVIIPYGCVLPVAHGGVLALCFAVLFSAAARAVGVYFM